MKKPWQLSFTGKGLKRPDDRFGGALLKGNPKSARPLESKLPLHLVLRASASVLRTPKAFAKVDRLVCTVARRHGVRVYDFANVGNHLHLVVKIIDRRRWAGFIRELTGRISLAIGGRNRETTFS
jgi:REP element-mobilizing transposase RayT